MIINGMSGPDHLIGGADDDTLNGLDGDDTLEGRDGNDQIFGGAGGDHLYGGAGADFLDGGSEFDLARYDNSSAGVSVNLTTNTGVGGDAQGDTFNAIEGLVGSAFADVLVGNGVDNVIYGLGGDDVLYGGSGSPNDRLYGGDGNDHVYVNFFSDVLYTLVDGGDGYDLARFDYSTSGITASTSRFVSIEGLVGSPWNDILSGGPGDNILYGMGGDDILQANGGTDTLYGNDGSDVFYGDLGNALMDGGAGLDMVRYENSAAGVVVNLATGLGSGGSAAGDTYTSIEAVAGSNLADTLIGDAADNILYGQGGDDQLHGGAGNDQLYGGAGDDQLEGGAGSNLLDGGDGFDIARFDSAPATGVYSGISVNLQTGAMYGVNDTLTSIEGVVGSYFNDILIGSDGDNLIDGGNGNDVITGGAGNDKLYGGAYADTFRFGDGSGADQILDFSAIDGPVTGEPFSNGHDQIGILTNVNGSGIVDYATLLPHIQESMMAGVTIDLGGGASIYVPNLHMADLSSSLFFFYT
ncbi:MAG: calcium-binding protein [Caulobacter sp.]|nr:calcium-binding protein [Caulobacter sp.]